MKGSDSNVYKAIFNSELLMKMGRETASRHALSKSDLSGTQSVESGIVHDGSEREE